MSRLLGLFAVVEPDREHQDRALHGDLQVGRDAEQVQAILQRAIAEAKV